VDVKPTFDDDGFAKEQAIAFRLEEYLGSVYSSAAVSISCEVVQGNQDDHTISCEILVEEEGFEAAFETLLAEIRITSREEDAVAKVVAVEAVIPGIVLDNASETPARQLFSLALRSVDAIEDSAANGIAPLPVTGKIDGDPNYGRSRKDYEHVIVLIHGIRDIGAWQNKVSRPLAQAGTAVTQIRYGLYPAVRFLFPINLSAGPVRKVIKGLQDVRSEYPNARVSVVAHSFGTYVLLRALKQDHNLQLWKIVFCGSVADDLFEWAEVKRRVGDGDRATRDFVINDCGTGDSWPMLGAAFGWHYGMAGVTGFSESFVTNRFHRSQSGASGGHGLYFDPLFVKEKWRPFLIGDQPPSHGDGEQGEHLPFYVRFLYHGWVRWICRILLLAVWGVLSTVTCYILYWCIVAGYGYLQSMWVSSPQDLAGAVNATVDGEDASGGTGVTSKVRDARLSDRPFRIIDVTPMVSERSPPLTDGYQLVLDLTVQNHTDEPLPVAKVKLTFDPKLRGSLSGQQAVDGVYLINIPIDAPATTTTGIGQTSASAWYPNPDGACLIITTPLSQTVPPKAVERFRLKLSFEDKDSVRGPMAGVEVELSNSPLNAVRSKEVEIPTQLRRHDSVEKALMRAKRQEGDSSDG